MKNTIMQQLVCNGYSQKELDVFAYIAQCLDANGYFTMEIAELARQLSLTESECRRYLDIMKSLEPTGICASSLQECLLMQLKDQTGTALEKAIILEHLELLGKNQFPVIAKKLKVSIEKVKKASEHIRQLNPRPADGYGASGYIRYIEPDITVVKFENRFEILLNDYRCPVVHISKDYLQMLKSDCPKDVKNYLQKKISQAEQLSECISQRGNTLMELAEFLVDAQTGFFLNGEQALRPLGLRDAAQKLSIHESTVSRAVKNKYLQCCWGIYPLSFFFKRRAAGKEDINAAAYLIQKELAQIIAQEDKKHPFNDEKLADLLKAKGYGISRRTAAKYREAMGIANSRERKFF